MGISPQDFEKMRSRLGGSARPKPSAVAISTSSTPITPTKSPHQTILGIDPSLRGTGFGIIRLGKPVPALLDSGTIHCPATWEHSRCLVLIAQTLRDAIKRHQPTVCIIESLFYAQNFQTALIMGEARGASLVAAAEAGLEIFEMAPRKVKQAIVGYGAAQKSAVAKMVQRMLRLPEPPAPDAADALALALTFIHETGRYSLTSPKKV
jgi:crossover junction endodeoxyribonuclease RuvC